MSEWKKVKLGDILQVKKGEYITKKEAHDGIYPVILGGKEPAYYIDKYNHTGKAIVISRSGASAGYVSFWNEPIFVTDGFLIEPKDTLTYEFLYYALKSKQSLLHNAQKGAAIPHVTPSLIGDIDFFLPSADTQHRIATILSRYDSLIENYQKQIKLLEEAAQRLYKEWFVDLRFPGHENTKIVDGVPEGWEKKNLGSIIDYEIGGGWGDETKVTPDHVTAFVIRGTDMNNLENGNLQGLPLRYHQSGNFIARQLQEYDIVFEVSGGSKTEGVAKTFLVLDQFLSQLDYPVICASFCKLIRLKKKEDACYVYDTLKEWRDSGITSQYDKRSASSIVNYRWKDFLSQQDIFVPSEDVLSRYTIISKKNHFMRVDLASQIRFLTEARDRLLPKLMSGEIAV
jgi:type I restriction enzyme S subunit